MNEDIKFEPFPKIARLNRNCIITEKIDGTNASVIVTADMRVVAASKNQLITTQSDNFGFARWVDDNADELLKLGVGQHTGEWWGSGIQRRYGLTEKRFSLINTAKWRDARPACCHVVPVMYDGPFDTREIGVCLNSLRDNGSVAAPGFMKPEGVIIWHGAARLFFKATLEKDEEPKGLARAAE